jgi:RNA polymerase sigma factor (sigma-70 family)
MTAEEWYESLLPLLLRYAERKFRVPAEVAEDIAHDVFLSFLERQKPVHDPRSYLIGAMSHGCRSYWRRQSRVTDEPLPERWSEPRYVELLTAHQVLRKLPRRQREVLLLRAAGFSVKEIAVRIALSVGGTEKVLRRALDAAAELADETERWRVGRCVSRTDTYPSARAELSVCAARRIIRAHVRRLRGAAVPRTHSRAAVLPSDGCAARQVPGQLSGAHGLLPASRRFA